MTKLGVFFYRLLLALADATPAFRAQPELVSVKLGRRFLMAIAEASPAFRPPPVSASSPAEIHPQPRLAPETPPASDIRMRHPGPGWGRHLGFLAPLSAALSVVVITLSVLLVSRFTGQSLNAGAGNPLISVASPYAVLYSPGSSAAEDAVFSPDGAALAVASGDGSIYLWTLATDAFTVLADQEGRGAPSIAFSPNGTVLAAGNRNGTTYLWNPATRKLVTTLRCPGAGPINAVAFSPDGKELAAVSKSASGSACIWAVPRGTRVASLPREQTGFSSAAFSPDGKILAVGGLNGVAYLWDPATSAMLGELRVGELSSISSLAFTADGTELAVATSSNSTSLWNIAPQRLIAVLVDPGRGKGITAIAISPDGRTLATADLDGNAYLWKLDTAQLIATLSDPNSDGITAVAISPDGRTLATADLNGSAFLWNLPATALSTPVPAPSTRRVPRIVSVTTYQQGVLVYFNIRYTDPSHNAEGFGFAGVNGSGWAEENHPFSDPSYGIPGLDSIAYPFNLACGTSQQYSSEVIAWIYDTAGTRSQPATINLTCK
jgi:hypothetical protein